MLVTVAVYKGTVAGAGAMGWALVNLTSIGVGRGRVV